VRNSKEDKGNISNLKAVGGVTLMKKERQLKPIYRVYLVEEICSFVSLH
jgi:hypothetical protein